MNSEQDSPQSPGYITSSYGGLKTRTHKKYTNVQNIKQIIEAP